MLILSLNPFSKIAIGHRQFVKIGEHCHIDTFDHDSVILSFLMAPFPPMRHAAVLFLFPGFTTQADRIMIAPPTNCIGAYHFTQKHPNQRRCLSQV